MSLLTCLNHPFLKNLGWLTSAQLLNKVFRLAATVIIARTLLPDEYGLIAIVFTVHDIVSVMISRGTQTQIINAPKSQLPDICQHAWRFNWGLCLFATLCQALAAVLVSYAFEQPALLSPILFLCVIHSFMPLAMVHASLNIRKGLLSLVAKIDVAQTALETLTCITLLYFNFGLWSLIIPRLVVLPIWIIIHRYIAQWPSKHSAMKHTLPSKQLLPVQHFHLNGVRVIATDLVIVLKNNIDYLLIGYFLGVEVLGIYYFAFNAGLGITTTLVQAAGSALLPHLCQQQHKNLKKEFYFAVKTLLICTSVIVAVQVSTLSFYIPVVFGERWVELGTLDIIAVLCLSAIPRAIIELLGQLLRAQQHLKSDLKLNVGLMLALTLSIWLVVPFGALAVAIAICAVNYLAAIMASIWVILFSEYNSAISAST